MNDRAAKSFLENFFSPEGEIAPMASAPQSGSENSKLTLVPPPPPTPEEPLLRDLGSARFSLRPLQYPDIFEWYKKHQACYWSAEELDLSSDPVHFKTLSADERHFIVSVLSFFSASDLLVNENLLEQFSAEISIPEVRCFYGFQVMMENIHSETYANMIEALCSPEEQRRAFSAIEEVPAIRRKHEWAMRYTDADRVPFVDRLVAFATFEGVLFSASFAAIFFFKQRGLMPGLTFSNELISRDEGIHCEFATHLYVHHVVGKLSDERAHQIVGEAVEAEEEFVREALHADLIGLSADRLIRYVHHVANRLLVALGHPKLYEDGESLPFVEGLSLDGSVNFFEKRNSSYSRRPVTAGEIGGFDEEF